MLPTRDGLVHRGGCTGDDPVSTRDAMNEGEAKRSLRAGVVGAGRMGRHHMQAIRRVGGDLVELVAVADPDEAARTAAAAEFGVSAHADLDAMLEAVACDVVHICTAPSTHAALARRALERGCHVYVEKPVATSGAELDEMLAAARASGRRICAGHQLLYEPPMEGMRRLLPAVGRAAHVESFFSFRTVRRAPGGRAPLRADEQLLDILPHPVYLLLEVLHRMSPGAPAEIVALEVDVRGTVHGLVRCGDTTGTLVVTLEGRPVESYLRVTGRNGVVHADFVRGTVQRLIGPGVSGIDKVLNPYRLAWQLLAGTTAALGRRLLRRQRSYPGLAELMSAFYRSILHGTPEPTPERQLLETVRIWEVVKDALRERMQEAEARTGPPIEGPVVVVTGGTGFLGAAVVQRLIERGYAPRVLSRRLPAPWERVAGVDYRVADLGASLDPALFNDGVAVIHCAAETAGGFEEHQRNSVDATANVLEAAAGAGVDRVVHVSSIAVLAAGAGPLADDTSLEPDPRSKGPYVWGKLESERLALAKASQLGLDLRVMRPGPILDTRDFEPPGRLGKRIGPVFVCPNLPSGRIAAVDRDFAADLIAWSLSHFDQVPPALNLVDPEPTTRRQLVERLRRSNPGLRVVWLPAPILVPLSLAAVVLQKVLRPSRTAVYPARAFADQNADTTTIRSIRELMMRPDPAGPPDVSESLTAADTLVQPAGNTR